MNIEFTALGDGGVKIVDPVERVHYTLFTPEPVTIRNCETEQFRFPIDGAARIECSRVQLPTIPGTLVRNAAGSVIAQIEHFSEETLPAGAYSIELSVPVRIYLRVDSRVELAADDEHLEIDFDGRTDVSIGVRSKHEQPAATITTTDDPSDILETVSVLSSSLKTTSPERSLPTLRGHPPEIELGDSLSIPDELSRPKTGISVEVPQAYRYIYPASTLAYYLGARLTPGDEPRLVTDDGFEYELAGALPFEDQVARTLKRVFFLDCVTRTEGLYPVPLRERTRLEERVDVSFSELYSATPAERLASYFEVPYTAIEDLLPDWKLTTHVSNAPRTIETLPFLINDLAIVRTADPQTVSQSSVEVTGMGAYTRGGETRSAAGATVDTTYVQVEEDDEAVEQAWIGEETPVGVSKATPDAYRNRFDRDPSAGDISITVICNDERMERERGVVDEVYGSRADLPFEVTMYHDLTTGELESVLSEPADFLHYIGHIDDDGFRCADGTLDATELSALDVDAFLLNACQSYQQGMALIDSGAIGGVVTLSDVINSGAIRIGSTLARLLNAGFPLRAALQIAKGESIVGSQYLVIGDGGLAITQAESGTPILINVDRQGDLYEVTIEAFPTTSGGMGGMFMPNVKSLSSYTLNSGKMETMFLTKEELIQFLHLEYMPVKISDTLRWSTSVDLDVLSN